jgi:hypothetical protein
VLTAPDTGRLKPLEVPAASELCLAAVEFDDEDDDFDAADESDEPDDLDGEDDGDDEDGDLVAPVAAFLPSVSFRPGWISDGSSPTASRLSA